MKPPHADISEAPDRGALDLRTGPALELPIRSGSVSTGIVRLAPRLRSPDSLDVEENHRIRLVSSDAHLVGAVLKVARWLSFAEQTVYLAVDARVRPIAEAYDDRAVIYTLRIAPAGH